MSQPQVGLIGLAVMGSNLAQNIESHGYPVAVFNRTQSLPQNLTQAQRDFFGAHAYERIDTLGVMQHTEWEKV